ncbi:MAG: hypothetical protein AAGN66_29625, partial [Acidobacteriota bacterium]
TLYLLDVLRDYKAGFIRQPRHLIEAWSIEIFAPTVALAERILERHAKKDSASSKGKPRKLRVHVNGKNYKLKTVDFNIKKVDYGTLMEWSHSSMVRLWKIGYEAGERFVDERGHRLPDRQPYSAMPKD